MVIWIWLSLLICIIGGIIYLTVKPATPANMEFKEVGRMMFWVGLLAWLLTAPVHYLAIR